jgi:negative regulator of sigma E activity
MPRIKCPARSRRKNSQGPLDFKTGCAKQRVAPATPNRSSEPQRRPQSRATQTARASVPTLDGELARRLSEQDLILTSNTVARAPGKADAAE